MSDQYCKLATINKNIEDIFS